MATTFKINNHVTLEVIKSIKTQQSRELLTYLFNKYGHNEVDQGQLMTELNLHQTDNTVLSEGSVRPISGTYEFYRKNQKSGWVNAGLVTITRSSKALDHKAYIESLNARIEYLEGLLNDNDIEFDASEIEATE